MTTFFDKIKSILDTDDLMVHRSGYGTIIYKSKGREVFRTELETRKNKIWLVLTTKRGDTHAAALDWGPENNGRATIEATTLKLLGAIYVSE